jgi:hypothetical protein
MFLLAAALAAYKERKSLAWLLRSFAIMVTLAGGLCSQFELATKFTPLLPHAYHWIATDFEA